MCVCVCVCVCRCVCVCVCKYRLHFLHHTLNPICLFHYKICTSIYTVVGKMKRQRKGDRITFLWIHL